MGAKLLPLIPSTSWHVLMHTEPQPAAASHFVGLLCCFFFFVPLCEQKACPGVMHIIARRAAAGFASPVLLRALCTSRPTGSRRLCTMADFSPEQVVFDKPKVGYQCSLSIKSFKRKRKKVLNYWQQRLFSWFYARCQCKQWALPPTDNSKWTGWDMKQESRSHTFRLLLFYNLTYSVCLFE